MNIELQDLSLGSIAKRFSDEGEAYLFLESVRWPDGEVCPHCGSIGHAYFLAPKDGARKTRIGKASPRRVWKCGDCRKQFSVLVGTIFEGCHIPLFKWLLAFHMLTSAKNGVAAVELHRTLKISVESAWFMAQRIRYALDGESSAVELQESAIDREIDSRQRLAAAISPPARAETLPATRRGGVIRLNFGQLADDWEQERPPGADISTMAMHPAYQRIIGMGPRAIPLLLARLVPSC